jgi:hypothetical protein
MHVAFYVFSLSLCKVTKENQENVSIQLASVLIIETLFPCTRNRSCNQDIASMDACPSRVGHHELFRSLILSLALRNNVCKKKKMQFSSFGMSLTPPELRIAMTCVWIQCRVVIHNAETYCVRISFPIPLSCDFCETFNKLQHKILILMLNLFKVCRFGPY